MVVYLLIHPCHIYIYKSFRRTVSGSVVTDAVVQFLGIRFSWKSYTQIIFFTGINGLLSQKMFIIYLHLRSSAVLLRAFTEDHNSLFLWLVKHLMFSQLLMFVWQPWSEKTSLSNTFDFSFMLLLNRCTLGFFLVEDGARESGVETLSIKFALPKLARCVWWNFSAHSHERS